MKHHQQRDQRRHQAPPKGVSLVQRRSTRAVFVFGILACMATPTITASLQLAARAACSAAFALALARLLELQYPIYALIGAVVVIDLSPARTRELTLQRIAGTVLGAAVGVALSVSLPVNPSIIGIGIFASMCLCHPLRLHGAERVTGYVCGIVMLDHAGAPLLYAGHRLVETLLGVGVAILVSFVPKLLRDR
jgi:uncharacterized membrane protein YgaE (UPF0421/DUF939 family)